jgi:prevent-host-death family protein
MDRQWQVQEAKAEFSALVAAAQTEPQIITRHGAPYAVVLSVATYDELSRKHTRPPLLSLLRDLPAFDVPARVDKNAREATSE